jgi:hypothetical protein
MLKKIPLWNSSEENTLQNDSSIDLVMLAFFEESHEELLDIVKHLKEKYNI